MPHLEPTFAEEFYVDRDPRIVALDFWSYINARQANLGWAERDHRLWWHLEQALADLKPVLVNPQQERFRPFLTTLADEWKGSGPVPSAPPGAVEEAEQVRAELADMLIGALARLDRSGASPISSTTDAVAGGARA